MKGKPKLTLYSISLFYVRHEVTSTHTTCQERLWAKVFEAENGDVALVKAMTEGQTKFKGFDLRYWLVVECKLDNTK